LSDGIKVGFLKSLSGCQTLFGIFVHELINQSDRLFGHLPPDRFFVCILLFDDHFIELRKTLATKPRVIPRQEHVHDNSKSPHVSWRLVRVRITATFTNFGSDVDRRADNQTIFLRGELLALCKAEIYNFEGLSFIVDKDILRL
jgi:hypothetical protein